MERETLLISSPAQDVNSGVNQGTLTSAADTSTTGVKSSYTVPNNVQGVLTYASAFVIAGTPPTMALQVVRGATTITLESGTLSVDVTPGFPLQAGDVVRWNVTAAGAGSTADFSIGVTLDRDSLRTTISFLGAAVLDSGINIYPGTRPLLLGERDLGPALREPVFAIAAFGTPTIAVVDYFR